jgi:hypothetical protein
MINTATRLVHPSEQSTCPATHLFYFCHRGASQRSNEAMSGMSGCFPPLGTYANGKSNHRNTRTTHLAHTPAQFANNFTAPPIPARTQVHKSATAPSRPIQSHAHLCPPHHTMAATPRIGVPHEPCRGVGPKALDPFSAIHGHHLSR